MIDQLACGAGQPARRSVRRGRLGPSLLAAVLGMAAPAVVQAGDPDVSLGPAVWRTAGPPQIEVYAAHYPYYYGGHYWRYHYRGVYYNDYWRGNDYSYHDYGHYCYHRYYRYGAWRCSAGRDARASRTGLDPKPPAAR